MDLYSGLPYWLVRDPLNNYFNPLREELDIPVVVIGSGITGSLVAHELCRKGIECCVVDKRSLSTGSSAASTALLQYAIDVPLCRMSRMMPEHDAATAFRSCLEAIELIERISAEVGRGELVERVPSLYLASNNRGLSLIKEEFAARRKHGLPVEFLDGARVRDMFGIEAPGALYNEVSGQTDAYELAHALLDYNSRKYGLRIFTHTEISGWKPHPKGYLLQTAGGCTIKCGYVIVAAGFEAGPFLPAKLMELTSTYAVISEPVHPGELWHKRSLVWETREPYLYIRTDSSNRIIVGGEDDSHNDPAKRVKAMRRKAAILEDKFRKMFPWVPFRAEMTWSGTFSSTRDGLPLIGPAGADPRMLFALGYGGNGITFSVIAARILAQRIIEDPDDREPIFSLGRDALK